MDLLFGLLIVTLIWENYATLYKFLTGKSNKEPYYYNEEDWNWKNWSSDDLP